MILRQLIKPMTESIELCEESSENKDYKRGYKEGMEQAISMLELMIVILEGRKAGDEA